MSTEHCDDCRNALPMNYHANDGKYLCDKCRELRAERFETVLYGITHRNKDERVLPNPTRQALRNSVCMVQPTKYQVLRTKKVW